MRDERVLRVLSRDNDEVDDGWLCDKGRFAYQAIHVDERITEPLMRDGGELRPVTGSARSRRPRGAAHAPGARTAALAGGEATNEEGFLAPALLREALGSADIDSRAGGGARPLELHARARRARRCRRPCPTSSSRTPCSCSTPSRSTTRRSSTCACARACAATACSSPSRRARPTRARRARAAISTLRAGHRRGAGSARSTPRSRAAPTATSTTAQRAAGADAGELRAIAARCCATRGEDVVILWGERLTAGPRGAHAARALLTSPRAWASPTATAPACCEIPAGANGRGLREAGVLPNAGPGLTDRSSGRPRRRARSPRRPAAAS